MSATIGKIGEGVATIAAVWLGYNAVVFVGIATGGHMKYVPYLNFPIKIFVWLMS